MFKIPWDLEQGITPIVEKIPYKTPRSFKGKLNRMFKYFRNKKVHIWYQYANSYECPDAREAHVKYDKFTIEGDYAYHVTLFKSSLFKTDKIVYEHIFEPDWEFQGLGELHLYGCGPGSHFSIRTYR